MTVVQTDLVVDASTVFAAFVRPARRSSGACRCIGRVRVWCVGRVVIGRVICGVVRRIIRVVVRVVVRIRIAHNRNGWVGWVRRDTNSAPAHAGAAIGIRFATRATKTFKTRSVLATLGIEGAGHLTSAIGALTARATLAVRGAGSTHDTAAIKTHFVGAAIDVHLTKRHADTVDAAELAGETRRFVFAAALWNTLTFVTTS